MNRRYFFFVVMVLLTSCSHCLCSQQHTITANQYESQLKKLIQSCDDSENGYLFTLLFQKIPRRTVDRIFKGKHTLLTLAAKNNKLYIVNFLINNGANLHHKSKEGTALVIALKNKSEGLVRLLIASGAYPSAFLPTWVETPKTPGMYYPTLNMFPDNYDKLNRAIINQFEIYKVCRIVCDDWFHLAYYAIQEANEKYDKRIKKYKVSVSSAISEHLRGIKDITNICVEYLMTPGIILPQNKNILVHLDEEYFVVQ